MHRVEHEEAARGAQFGIRFAIAPCSLGRLLVAATARGVCNVRFGDEDPELEKGLAEALGYEVPTFLRTADEVLAIAARDVFPGEVERSAGKLQVAMLGAKPTAAARRQVEALCTKADRLAVLGRELYWLPSGKITESELDLKSVERALGPMTMRTRRTLERLAAKYLAD